jgi:hypothetical protein
LDRAIAGVIAIFIEIRYVPQVADLTLSHFELLATRLKQVAKFVQVDLGVHGSVPTASGMPTPTWSKSANEEMAWAMHCLPP